MKSVALTEGKKAYFYDLNRQPGIKRNFSPKIRHTAGLQQAAWDAGSAACCARYRHRPQRAPGCGYRCQVCGGTRVPRPAGWRGTSAQDMFWLHKHICIGLLMESLQTRWACGQIYLQLWTLPLWGLFLSSSVAWLPTCPSFPLFCAFFQFSLLTSILFSTSPYPGPCLPVLALLSRGCPNRSAPVQLMDIP